MQYGAAILKLFTYAYLTAQQCYPKANTQEQ